LHFRVYLSFASSDSEHTASSSLYDDDSSYLLGLLHSLKLTNLCLLLDSHHTMPTLLLLHNFYYLLLLRQVSLRSLCPWSTVSMLYSQQS